MVTVALAHSAADDLYGTYGPARYTAQHIAGAKFIGFAEGGHLLVGDQTEVRSEIELFLSGVTYTPLSAERAASASASDTEYARAR